MLQAAASQGHHTSPAFASPQGSAESSLCPQHRIRPRLNALFLTQCQVSMKLNRSPSALSVAHAQAHHQVETVSARQLRPSSLPAAASLTVACPHPKTSAPLLICLDLCTTTLAHWPRDSACPVPTTTAVNPHRAGGRATVPRSLGAVQML